jgi:2-dehydro-3-deoxyglucarate aldolase/4-hydroxy-2-oxoheptanedioate aldolase
MPESFRDRLRAGERLLGTLITLPSPEVAEILAAAGFDWLFLDGEHGAFDVLEAQRLLQAVGERCPCLLRVPSSDEASIKKALDIGVAGVIVPQVNNADDAERVVRFSKYPPVGTRGVGIARAHGYGGYFGDYVARANEELAVVIQAEHIEAVRNIDAMAGVAGIDAVFVGPYDLSASMGKMGQVGDPEVQKAITRVRDSCLAAGLTLGIFGLRADAVAPYIAQGFTLIAAGCDSVFLASAARATLEELRTI